MENRVYDVRVEWRLNEEVEIRCSEQCLVRGMCRIHIFWTTYFYWAVLRASYMLSLVSWLASQYRQSPMRIFRNFGADFWSSTRERNHWELKTVTPRSPKRHSVPSWHLIYMCLYTKSVLPAWQNDTLREACKSIVSFPLCENTAKWLIVLISGLTKSETDLENACQWSGFCSQFCLFTGFQGTCQWEAV